MKTVTLTHKGDTWSVEFNADGSVRRAVRILRFTSIAASLLQAEVVAAARGAK